jgi:hypothetical protein
MANSIKTVVIPLLDSLEFFNLEYFSHLQLLILVLLSQLIDLLHLRVARVQGVEVVCELVRPVPEAVNADDRVLGNRAFLMV